MHLFLNQCLIGPDNQDEPREVLVVGSFVAFPFTAKGLPRAKSRVLCGGHQFDVVESIDEIAGMVHIQEEVEQ